jgi:negative regulator of flagellin synthesis FlgM
MKIGQQPEPLPAAAQNALPAGAKPAAATATAGRSTGGVDVSVSSLARTLEQTRMVDSSVVDMDKVNAVRQAIADGTFVANAEVIADKLLANAQEMLKRTLS